MKLLYSVRRLFILNVKGTASWIVKRSMEYIIIIHWYYKSLSSRCSGCFLFSWFHIFLIILFSDSLSSFLSNAHILLFSILLLFSYFLAYSFTLWFPFSLSFVVLSSLLLFSRSLILSFSIIILFYSHFLCMAGGRERRNWGKRRREGRKDRKEAGEVQYDMFSCW